MRVVEAAGRPPSEALELVERAYRGLDEVPEEWWHGLHVVLLVDDGSVRGIAGLRRLPGLLEAQPFAAQPGDAEAVRVLADHVSRMASRVRVVAPPAPHYAEGLRWAGYTPVRRILRIDIPARAVACSGPSGYTVRLVDEGSAADVARAFVEGLATHWDWWIRDDIGGYDEAVRRVLEWMRDGGSRWIVALRGDEPVGATGYRGWRRGRAWFAGVAVKPEHRMRGVGRLLLCTAQRMAASEGYQVLTVYTVAPLAGLAPGALLYLKQGGCVKTEYTHYEKQAQTHY